MTDRNNQEQTETEVTYQTFSKFLQNTPPNQFVHISDLAIPQDSRVFSKLNTPVLKLHCPDDLCDGDRFFRCVVVSDSGRFLASGTAYYFYVSYQCSNCGKTQKTYSLSARIDKIGESHGACYKFGELPPYGPPVSPKLIRLIQPDRDIFMKGYSCENQGLGIGAFTYYRRVVENQKNRILEQIVKVSQKIEVPEDQINILRAAIKEIQFRKALRMVKAVMPESLLINGQNPMLLLHRALSQGVHELSDQECLELASSVRVVLGRLSEKLSDILKDDEEVKGALSTLMNYNNN